MICPKCGSKSFEDQPMLKGSQKKCKKCGFIGTPMEGFF